MLRHEPTHLRLPDGRAVNGFSHCCKRHGTTTLFAALDVVTGEVQTGHYARRRRREFLDFMNEVVAANPGRTAGCNGIRKRICTSRRPTAVG